MKKKNGFLAVSIIFSFFIVFLMILTINMTSYAQNRILLNQIKKDIKTTTNLKIDKIEIAKRCNSEVEDCKCKRATNLHYEIDTSKIFGNLSNNGSDLISGDAFDCDVNGDGTYSENNERFYFLTTLSENQDYAVLVYYSNVLNGEPTDDGVSKYNLGDGDLGPTVAVTHLPSSSSWSNVSLYAKDSGVEKTITDELGNTKKVFSYYGYAARMIRYQEVIDACGEGSISSNGYLGSCSFLLEHTYNVYPGYPNLYWLETLSSNNNFSAWGIYSSYEYLQRRSVTDELGVRPVIEVAKEDIEY